MITEPVSEYHCAGSVIMKMAATPAGHLFNRAA